MRWCLACTVLATALLAGCGRPAPAPAGEVPRVATSIAPFGHFLERVAGGAAAVTVLVPQGQAAETFQVLPRQMEELSRAEVYFLAGLPFEEALAGKLRGMPGAPKIIDLREHVDLLHFDCEHGDDGHGHDHAHEGPDPHYWMDPLRVKRVASAMEAALAGAFPEHAAAFAKNRAALDAELDAVHARVAETLAPFRGAVMHVYHPAFGYFCERYGLVQEALESAGKTPGARRINELAESMKAAGVPAVFTQPQFTQGEAAALAAAVGARLVTLDDLAPDYAANLERIAGALAEGLKR
ncbi:MAG TPA: zinc ABC transporter substrate-binding protein [Candidatus Hydrogenedentes bacterium]|nr:zinc ABC transporter substrate-binding protein [Candidatus Hydrogenedentota bacterium]